MHVGRFGSSAAAFAPVPFAQPKTPDLADAGSVAASHAQADALPGSEAAAPKAVPIAVPISSFSVSDADPAAAITDALVGGASMHCANPNCHCATEVGLDLDGRPFCSEGCFRDGSQEVVCDCGHPGCSLAEEVAAAEPREMER